MKVYLYHLLCFLLLSPFPPLAQTIDYDVDGLELYGDCGSGDCCDGQDNYWHVRVNDNINSSWDYWDEEHDDIGTGWFSYSDYGWRTENGTNATTLYVEMIAWEDDPGICIGGSDDDCEKKTYQNIKTITIKDEPPCSDTEYHGKRDPGTWEAKWQVRWDYNSSVSPGCCNKIWYGYDNNWHKDYNWSGCSTPTSSDDVYIPDPSNTIKGNNPTITNQADCNTITINSSNGAEVTIDNGAGGDLEVHK